MDLTVKQWRMLKDLSQEQMAERIGIHRNTYASWEENPGTISISNALTIADALDVSVDSIIFATSSTKCRVTKGA